MGLHQSPSLWGMTVFLQGAKQMQGYLCATPHSLPQTPHKELSAGLSEREHTELYFHRVLVPAHWSMPVHTEARAGGQVFSIITLHHLFSSSSCLLNQKGVNSARLDSQWTLGLHQHMLLSTLGTDKDSHASPLCGWKRFNQTQFLMLEEPTPSLFIFYIFPFISYQITLI